MSQHDEDLWLLILAAHLFGYLLQLFSSPQEVVFVNFSHVCTGSRELSGWWRKSLLSCPPVRLLSLSSAPYSVAKPSRRLSRLPRSLHRNHTGRGVWEAAVTQCVHQWVLTFISMCHDPSQSEAMDVNLALVWKKIKKMVMWDKNINVPVLTAFIIPSDKILSPQTLLISVPYQNI